MAQTYSQNNVYKQMGDALLSVGRATAAARKANKSFNPQKYSGIVSNLYGPALNTPGAKDLKSLGALTTPYGGNTKFESFHPGVDIANKIGTPIPAYRGGTVVEAQSGLKQGDKGYGNSLVIQDAQGNKWRYSHLNGEYVKVGQKVVPGMVIGQMGNSGSTYSTSGGTGSHLDLRIKDAYGRYLDPNSLL